MSTQPESVRGFFGKFYGQTKAKSVDMAILEVWGFNQWLLAMLRDYGCRETVLVRVEERQKPFPWV